MLNFDNAIRADHGTDEIVEWVEAFNEEHPDWALRARELHRYMVSRAKCREAIWSRVHINPRLVGKLRYGVKAGRMGATTNNEV
ncbi:hypothetical protein SxD43FB_05650 [Sphingobium sp. D43FB]|nr:hypothetical protein SxD43FB_05650 [Sphingobium sp. D43FB]